jgi:hypothetical protein
VTTSTRYGADSTSSESIFLDRARGLITFRTAHLDAAASLLAYVLPSSYTGGVSPTATAVCEILAEFRLELALAASLRRDNFAAADAVLDAFDAELDRTADAASAVATARALRTLYGPRWERRLPETARRLGSLIWLDVINNEDDHGELAKVLDRHYPTKAVAA